jgi:hypothetical protein
MAPHLAEGSKHLFNYPEAFTTLPEYSAHRGQVVEVVRPLTAAEYDNEGDAMYLVRAADGWEGHAFDSELQPVAVSAG